MPNIPESLTDTHSFLFILDHILSHFEGAEILVHALDLRVICGILVTIQQPIDGFIIVVNHAAVVLFVLSLKENKNINIVISVNPQL